MLYNIIPLIEDFCTEALSILPVFTRASKLAHHQQQQFLQDALIMFLCHNNPIMERIKFLTMYIIAESIVA